MKKEIDDILTSFYRLNNFYFGLESTNFLSYFLCAL